MYSYHLSKVYEEIFHFDEQTLCKFCKQHDMEFVQRALIWVGLEEFEDVVQTRDVVEGLHNFREFFRVGQGGVITVWLLHSLGIYRLKVEVVAVLK